MTVVKKTGSTTSAMLRAFRGTLVGARVGSASGSGHGRRGSGGFLLVLVMVAAAAAWGWVGSGLLREAVVSGNTGTRAAGSDKPLGGLGAVVFLAPERHVGSDWGIDRFCLLLRAVRSVDEHLNVVYGPYPIYVLVARDHSSNPRRKDGPYTAGDRALIRRWAPRSTVVFVEVDLYTGDALEPGTTPSGILAWRRGENGAVAGRDLGYTSMCRLWSGRLQAMPFLDSHEYYLRMDDDSLLTGDLPFDPFRAMKDRGLVYAYKRTSNDHWGIDRLWEVAKPHLDLSREDLPPFADSVYGYSGDQPYNNFHVSRVDFWRSPAWRSLWRDMNEAHLFFKHRVGDANVHAMALLLMGTRDYEEWPDLPYVHNSNDYGPRWGTKAWARECQTDYEKYLVLPKRLA